MTLRNDDAVVVVVVVVDGWSRNSTGRWVEMGEYYDDDGCGGGSENVEAESRRGFRELR